MLRLKRTISDLKNKIHESKNDLKVVPQISTLLSPTRIQKVAEMNSFGNVMIYKDSPSNCEESVNVAYKNIKILEEKHRKDGKYKKTEN